MFSEGEWTVDPKYSWIRCNGEPIIGCWGANKEANARLCCQAPKLYEALKEIRIWLQSDGVKLLGEGLYEQMEIPKTMTKIDKAIALVEEK